MSSIYIQEPPTSGKVLLKTSVGDIDIELWPRECPKACRNFVQLCMEGYYNNTLFHRVVRGFIAQGGDPYGDGSGGDSIWGITFKDEFHSRLRFNRRGLVGMANAGKDDNGSQFFFTMAATPELQDKNTLFGKVTGDTVFNMLKLEDTLVDHNDRPQYPHKIIKTKVLLNPFTDIVPRRAITDGASTSAERKEKKKEVEKQTEAEPSNGAVKNFALLSFGEEAEEDECMVSTYLKKYPGKSKSIHKALNEPKFSKKARKTKVVNDDDEESKDDNFTDYETDYDETEEMKTEEMKTEEKKNEDKTTEDKKTEEKKTEEKEPEEKKIEEKKIEEKKSEEMKTEENKTEEKKTEEKKTEENETEEKKIEEKKSEVKISEEKKSEEKKTENKKTEEKKTEEKKTEDKKTEDKKTEDKKTEEKKTEETEPEEKKIEVKKSEVKKSEENKTEEKKTGEKKSEEMKTEEKKTGENKTGENKTEEKKTGEKENEGMKIEEKKTEEKKTEDKKTEDKKTGEKKTGEKKSEEMKTDDKKTGENKTEEKKTGEKKNEGMKIEGKKTEENKTEDKKTEDNKTQEKKTEKNKTQVKTEKNKPEERKAKEKKPAEKKTDNIEGAKFEDIENSPSSIDSEDDIKKKAEIIKNKLKSNPKKICTEVSNAKIDSHSSDEDFLSTIEQERKRLREKKAAELRDEIKLFKKQYRADKKKNEDLKAKQTEKVNATIVKKALLKDYKTQQDKYSHLKEKTPKQGTSREDFTLSLLAKFREKVDNLKQNVSENDEANIKDEAVENDIKTDNWLSHNLKFENNQASLAKDASTKSDDWYDVFDPRNSINKRKRGEQSGSDIKKNKI